MTEASEGDGAGDDGDHRAEDGDHVGDVEWCCRGWLVTGEGAGLLLHS